MQNRLRFLALMAVGLAVATVAALIGNWAQRESATGTVLAETTTSAPAPTEESTPSYEPEPEPTTTTRTTSPTTTSSSNGLTIATRKTVTTPPPACAALVTKTEITQLTGATATPETATQEPEDSVFCSFNLTRSGTPAGLVLVVLTPTTESKGSEKTTFAGNTAYRTTTATSTCDLRVALTDDSIAKFKALWVTVVLTDASESTCPKVEQLAKTVFDKLP
ncbi:MAG: hypothetical protein ABW215_02520 [Kibdelosporangium sp.]